MPDHSPHQKRIIDRYYRNRDSIMVSRLQEIVTELFLAESDSKRNRLWDRAAKAMRNLKWKESVIEHILASRRPDVLATNLESWAKGENRSP